MLAAETPRASVILPTHKDPGTLQFAVASVLHQSESNFELLIVCDGADEQTLATAHRFSELDTRVQVLDLPKGTGLGEENRHLAVELSTAPIIFYIDEDDLWLPDHLSRLLEAIETSRADVACSSVASVASTGTIEIAPYSHARGPLRSLLRERTFRALFKIHMCHTKEAYLGLAKGWRARPNGEIVLYLLSDLAEEHHRWTSIPEVTALSFHGSPRRANGVSNTLRTREIERLWKDISALKFNGAVANKHGSVVHYFFNVLFHVSAISNDLNLYLKQLQSDFKPHQNGHSSSGRHRSFWKTTKFPEPQAHEVRLTAYQTRAAQALLDYRVDSNISLLVALRILKSLRSTVAGPPALSRDQGVRFIKSVLLRSGPIF